MNPGVSEEVGHTTRSFFEILKEEPLSLALVMMNVLLVAYLFYSQAQTLGQRKEALDQIVQWQRATDQLMANCVSRDVMELVVNALERDRELYRRLLPPFPGMPPIEGPKLQSDESHPFVLPPITPLPTE